MKYLIAVFLLFPHLIFAQAENKIKRSQYYNAGMIASVKNYDAILSQKIKEGIIPYQHAESQYKLQQQRVTIIADNWANQTFKNKNSKKALELIAKNNIAAAIQLLTEKTKGKSFGEHNDEELKLLSELYQISGNYIKAIEVYSTANFKNSLVENKLQYLNLLSINIQIAEGLKFAEDLATTVNNDTISLIRLKMISAELYQISDANSAKGKLIDAQYLLSKIKQDSLHMALSGNVLIILSKLQLAGGSINEAYQNAKSGVEILENFKGSEELANALSFLGGLYFKAGANQEADTTYKVAISIYKTLAVNYPERFNVLLADVSEDYLEVQKYYDRRDDLAKSLEKNIIIRKNLAKNTYPFFTLDYARSIGKLADKLVYIDNKMLLSEVECLKEKAILEPLYAKYPLLAGYDFAKVLNNLADIKMALKNYSEVLPLLKKSLEVREYLYKLDPEKNKSDLMYVVVQNGSVNGIHEKNIQLSIAQLNRGIKLANELGDAKFAKDIEILRSKILANNPKN